jgi:putative transposase
VKAVEELVPVVGTEASCRALSVSRATVYRRRAAPAGDAKPKGVQACPRRIGGAERQAIVEVLHRERFVDQAPAAVYATLLDEGTYLCSERTMYRVLAEHGEARERRDQLRHPRYAKPELLATGPNQVWSWDISVPQQAA